MSLESAVNTESNQLHGHSWEVATVTIGLYEKLDLESLGKKDGCTVRLIKRDGNNIEYEFTMVSTPTCPRGTHASIEIDDDDEGCTIFKVVASDFVSRHALLDFLHYVCNVDLAESTMVGIYLQGVMGDVLHPGDEELFASLFGSESDFEKTSAS